MNHITQDEARAIFSEVTKEGKGFATTQDIMNAAIQHYIDQQAKELPVLPEPRIANGEWFPRARCSNDHYTSGQLKYYGAASAAHAREMALDEVGKIVYLNSILSTVAKNELYCLLAIVKAGSDDHTE